MTDNSWQDHAACRGHDTDLWFPERGQVATEAKRICAGCTVKEPCLELGRGEKYGVWGGVSVGFERKRQAMAERKRAVETGERSRMRKRCSACLRTKPLLEFFVDRSRPDGHMAKCKECRTLATKARNIRFTN